MGFELLTPIRNKRVERAALDGLTIGTCEMQGYRCAMEDAHVVALSLPRHPSVALLAVLDGHRGSAAAQHFARELVPAIDALPLLDAETVRRCVTDMDARFLASSAGPESKTGTTLVFALVERLRPGASPVLARTETAPPRVTEPDPGATWYVYSERGDAGADSCPAATYRVLVVNVGDSRCLVGRPLASPSFEQVTEDHRPDLPRERERIYAAGGTVYCSRVDGYLAVSRALGNVDLKGGSVDPPRAPAPPHEHHVSAVPDVFGLTASAGDWLLLACDGVYEELSSEHVAGTVASELRADAPPGGSPDPGAICSTLLDASLASGSMDNMSAILVLLGERDPTTTGCQERRAVEYLWDPYPHWNGYHPKAYEANVARYGFSVADVRRLVSQAGTDERATGE